ncbi:sensor histidine kinase [Paraburkholderia rhizosphaerae]|uniref:histidine kinase n=1 Tax=Paraburkholderia rhizosphaerae TaxID=480658 RepID=A0A4R8LKX8_9BURK|nr:HAMP domain-containing sensor histidine kinase [Paraburkholderia rhizosphaerae]TDY45178.1 histidine kinase/DNA gyrase B/HSP90-like ATPase [Paraburkholderia rhizosphaerae]
MSDSCAEGPERQRDVDTHALRDEFDALLETQPWGTVAVDSEQKVLFATAGAMRLLQREIRVGTSFEQLLCDCGALHFGGDASWTAPVENRASCMLQASGQGIEFQVGARWIWLRQDEAVRGGQIAAVFAFVDITDMRRALDERMESLRFMSHDLRSPQNSIVALTQLHEHDPRAFEECGGIQRIAELARYALSLGDQFVLTSVDNGLQGRDLTRFDLCATVRTVIAQLDVSAVYRGVPLRLWLAEGAAVWMTGVRVFVARALQNLVDNAIRVSAAGDPVTVSLKVAECYAVITVGDAAGGLPGLAAHRVMTNFDTLTEQSSGAFGLGLKLTERIVRLHGGKLHAESNANAGTDFVMRLPCLGPRPNFVATPGARSGQGRFATLERPDANSPMR